MKFLEFRCPNSPHEGSNYVCHHELAGPAMLTLMDHDFTKSAFVDCRYCEKCGVFWQVTITGLNTPPTFELIRPSLDVKLDFLSAERFFGTLNVSGRKTTKCHI